MTRLQNPSHPHAVWATVRDALWTAIAEQVQGTRKLRDTLQAKAQDPMTVPWPPPELLRLALQNQSADQLFARTEAILEEDRKKARAPYRTLRFQAKAFLKGMASITFAWPRFKAP